METYIAIVEEKYDKQDVIHALHSLGEIVELFDNAFLIKTRYSATDIRDEVEDSLEGTPKIYVCRLARGSAWRNLEVPSTSIKDIYSNEED